MATRSESFSYDTGLGKIQVHCLLDSCIQLLKPRSSYRLILGILLLATFACVIFWVRDTPSDVNQEKPEGTNVQTKGHKRSVSVIRAQGNDDLAQDYATGANSSFASLFAAEVRVLTKSLTELKIVLTTTNMGFLDFTDNMLMSINRVGLHPQVVVIVEDRAVYKALRRHKYGLHVLKPPDFDKLPEALAYGAAEEVNFLNRRPTYLREFIRQGYEVLVVNSDSFWYGDPYPHFIGGNFDVAFMRQGRRTYSEGVGFYRPTNRTEYLLQVWVWVLDTQPKLRHGDRVLSKILNSRITPELKVRSLAFQNFPAFINWYDLENDECRKIQEKTTLFQAAFTPQFMDKRQAFKDCNIWLVNNTTEKTSL